MNKIEMCNNRIWTKSTSAWSWLASYSFGAHFIRADLLPFWMQLLDICQVLVNFSRSFLFGKQFWASLHLLSESGWNWCPWQALVSFRFPIPMHCIFMSLSFSRRVGGFFQSRVALSWTEGSFSHFTLGNWAEHCFLKFQSCIWSSCHELLKSLD